MGFLRNLFSSKEPSAEEREQKRQANDFDVLKYDGIHAMQIGRFAYAIACFTHALEIREDQETREHLAIAYIRSDDLESAVDEFSKLSSLIPESLHYPTNKANLLYELEEYAESRQLCEELLERDSGLATASFILGKISKAEGKLDDAERYVSDAISKRDNFVEALLFRSEVRYDRGDYASSLEDLNLLLSNNHDSDEVLLQKGKVLEAMSKPDEAILYYNNVLNQNPFFIEAYGKLALLYINSGDYSQAEQVLSDGLEQNGSSSVLVGIRAELKAAQGDAAGAEADRKQAAELKAAEEERENEDYDVEREIQERMKSVNPLA